MVIGTYLKIPPGSASLRDGMDEPVRGRRGRNGWRRTGSPSRSSRACVPGPLTLHIRVPEGYRISAASPELTVDGATATLATTFAEDIVVAVRYER